MAKRKGEPVKGVRCARCRRVVSMEEKMSIKYMKYGRRDDFFPNISSNHVNTVVNSFNLCPSCFSIIDTAIMNLIAQEDDQDERLYSSSLRREG